MYQLKVLSLLSFELLMMFQNTREWILIKHASLQLNDVWCRWRCFCLSIFHSEFRIGLDAFLRYQESSTTKDLQDMSMLSRVGKHILKSLGPINSFLMTLMTPMTLMTLMTKITMIKVISSDKSYQAERSYIVI